LIGQSLILVVDDQEHNRKLLTDLLGANDFQVVTAVSGTEALEKVKALRPDLVLLDVVMPDLSGYEVCARIRADPGNPVLPVVMVTALDPTEERIKGLQAGADDFLSKPLNKAELLARVKSLLRIKTLYDKTQDQAVELRELNAGLERRVQEQIGQLQRLTQLKRFFPQQLAELIVAGDVEDPLKTHRREVTVVFLDLRGFTAFADTSEPEEVIQLLRNYHAVMGGLVHAHGGSLEQFTGDAMMVIFNDPVVVEDPAARAVRMALDMHEHFGELTVSWRKRGHDIALGIGIAHGYATIGAIGFEARMGYGVIGRVTNLASRLCAEAQPGQILISAAVQSLVEDLVDTVEMGQVNLKGFARPISAYNVLRRKTNEHPPEPQNWPLKVFTFGQFSLVLDGKPLTFSRKAQKRPLDLFKALIGSGGRTVKISALIEALWPDSEGDAAQVAFDSTLYRLRKLINMDSILQLSEGKLSLDSQKCWTDVWALDELVTRIDSELHSATHQNGNGRDHLARELLRLCTGLFLEKDSQEPWAVQARDKLKAKFLRAVTLLGSELEQRKQWPQAIALYARALELDNLTEGLYRRLMICYREQGEPAEALNVYRRCRDILSIVLNVKPSPETEAIHASLGR
jgi:class 3 adenylate cyclase/CheY-like chemotaxis protein/DNA-binding SARP family transcriptional activator